MAEIILEREYGGELAFAIIHLGGEPLVFHNDQARVDLDLGQTYQVDWWIGGGAGASLAVRKSLPGGEPSPVVETSIVGGVAEVLWGGNGCDFFIA